MGHDSGGEQIRGGDLQRLGETVDTHKAPSPLAGLSGLDPTEVGRLQPGGTSEVPLTQAPFLAEPTDIGAQDVEHGLGRLLGGRHDLFSTATIRCRQQQASRRASTHGIHYTID